MTDPIVLEQLGLRGGEPVRFRRNGSGRWVQGRVSGIAADGSITLLDSRRRRPQPAPRRSRCAGPAPAAGCTWQVVSDVAITWEQLELW